MRALMSAAPEVILITDLSRTQSRAPARRGPAHRSERHAIAWLFEALNKRNLTLPGDPKRLPLRLEIHPAKEATYELWRESYASDSL